LPAKQPAVEHHLQPIQRMHAVDEVAAPVARWRLLLVLLVLGDELLLLGAVGLEQEGAGLVEGAAQAFEQLAHASRGELPTEVLLDPVAHLLGAAEASGGDLLLELVELGRVESAGVALVVQRTQRVEALALEEGYPVAEGAWADVQQVGDLLDRVPL